MEHYPSESSEQTSEGDDEKLIVREIFEDAENQVNSSAIEDIVKLLSHENVVKLCGHSGFDQEGERRETIWEYSDAGTLEQYIDRRRRLARLLNPKQLEGLPESFDWHTFISLLRAVVYLHTGHTDYRSRNNGPQDWMPVVHNSINPENIFYQSPVGNEKQGTCKLGNFSRCTILASTLLPQDDEEVSDRLQAFGISRFFEQETGYEAPELLVDREELPGPASDLWSIGAVMVAMMTGHTIWDLLLEAEFANRARSKWRSRAKLPETWQDVPLAQRHSLLRSFVGTSEIAAHCLNIILSS